MPATNGVITSSTRCCSRGDPGAGPVTSTQGAPMKLKLLTLLLAATAMTAACSDDNDNTAPEGEARVRVVHASPDAPNVDVLVDDAKVLSDVPYLAASGYLAVPAG